jgi:hypothetical protein
MTDGNTYAINQHLNDREDWDELQEVTAALEDAEARIEELEAKLARAVIGLRNVIGMLDDPTGGEHVRDMRAATMIARTTLTELTGGNDE